MAVKIPLYQQQTVPVGPARPYADRVDVSSGLQDLAGAVRQGEGILAERRRAAERQQDEMDRADATKRLQQARVDAVKMRTDLAQKAGPGGSGFRASVMEEWGKYRSKSLEAVTAPGAKKYLEEGFNRLAGDLELDALEYETAEGMKHREATYDEAKENAKLVIQADPTKLKTVLAEVLAPMQGEDAVTAERRKAYTRELGITGAIEEARVDPYGVVKALDGADTTTGRTGRLSLDIIDAEDRMKIRSAAQAEISRREAEVRQARAFKRIELSDRVKDYTAAAMVGVTLPDAPTREDFYAAFDDKAEAEKAYRRFLPVIPLGGDIAALAQADPAKQAEIVGKYQPAIGAGFAEGQERFEIVQRAQASLNKARETDAAGYAVNYDSATRSAYTAMVETAVSADATPEQRSQAALDYINQVKAAKERLGIDGGTVLPKPFAESIVGQFYRQEEGGQPAAASVMVERAKWGPAWGEVWNQIKGDVPGAAYVIGEGMPAEPAGRLALLSTQKIEELRKTLPAGLPPSEVGDSVRDELGDYIASVSWQPGWQRLADPMLDAAERLTIDYVGRGKGVNGAATQAALEVVNGRFNFITAGDAVIRVPVDIDDTEVARGLGAMTYAERRALGSNVFDEAQWATLEDNQGVALIWNGQLVERPDGTPVIYTWDALRNKAATNRETARELDRDLAPYTGTFP